MKFLVPNYSCLQNPWLGGYRPQIPVLSVVCPQLNLLNSPRKKFLGTLLDVQHVENHNMTQRCNINLRDCMPSIYTFPHLFLCIYLPLWNTCRATPLHWSIPHLAGYVFSRLIVAPMMYSALQYSRDSRLSIFYFCSRKLTICVLVCCRMMSIVYLNSYNVSLASIYFCDKIRNTSPLLQWFKYIINLK